MLLFANKARTLLTGSVTSAAGQVAAVTTSSGALFVGVGGVATSTANPMRCVITAVDANGNDTGAFEIVEITRSADNLTLVSRGLEGTTAAAWSAGAVIECRSTADAPRAQNVGVARKVGTSAYRTGRYYDGSSVIGAGYNYYTPATTMTAFPFLCSVNHTFLSIGTYVIGAAPSGKRICFAIYQNDPVSGNPGALVVGTAISTLADSTGVKEVTISAALLEGELYWLVLQTEDLSAISISGMNNNLPPVGGMANIYAIGSSQPHCGLSATPTYAAFVADGTTYTWYPAMGSQMMYLSMKA
jgi:hypothetical protein